MILRNEENKPIVNVSMKMKTSCIIEWKQVLRTKNGILSDNKMCLWNAIAPQKS